MSSTRQTARFYINSNSIGKVIRNCSKIRKMHGDGPFIKVHQDTSKKIDLRFVERRENLADGYITQVEYGSHSSLKLYVSNDTQTDEDGNIQIVLVEVSSWNKATTVDMVNALWKVATEKPKIYKNTYDVEGSAQDKNTITSMVIGRGGSNLRRLVARRGKAYVDRDVAPNRFIIIANSAKDALSIKHDIQREARKISTDVARRHTPTKPTRKFAKTDKHDWFGLFTDQSDDEDEQDMKAPLPREPLRTTSRSTKPTLAEMLEDSAARGETFCDSPALIKKRAAEERIRMIKHMDTTSSDDDMPALVLSSGDDIFSVMAKNCTTNEWGME